MYLTSNKHEGTTIWSSIIKETWKDGKYILEKHVTINWDPVWAGISQAKYGGENNPKIGEWCV